MKLFQIHAYFHDNFSSKHLYEYNTQDIDSVIYIHDKKTEVFMKFIIHKVCDSSLMVCSLAEIVFENSSILITR
jgi:hypothetical protein